MKCCFVAHAAGADERHAEAAQFLPEFLDILRARVSPGAAVDGDEPVHAGGQPLVGPLPLGHVVIHHAAHGMRLLDHPLRVAERGHEEAHPLLERHVHPAHHPLVVGPRRGLDEGVHADRPAGEPPDEAEPLAEVVAVHVGERDRLHDAEPAGLRHRGDELGIAAGIHGAADERHLDPGLPGERGAGQGLTSFQLSARLTREAADVAELSRQVTAMRATVSPAVSRMSACTR